MNIRQVFSAALLAASTLLAACGGGGGASSTQAGINGGGVTAPGVAVGPITGFGSVFVNGIEFDLSGSSVTVDDRVSSGQTDLRVGQVVTVKGSINQTTGRGTATSVVYSNNLHGVVSAVNLTANTFDVVGQTITITGATVFEGKVGLSALAVNDAVEVSGFVDATGKIVATRVELKSLSSNVSELSGTVSAPVNQSFTIGTTTIDYHQASSITGALIAGACVEVKGVFSAGVLLATSVAAQTCNLSVNNNDLGEIEGIITTGLSGTQFSIGSTQVSIASSPTYSPSGTTSTALIAGKEVEVEGTFSVSNGVAVLNARKIEIKQDTAIRMSGLVESVNATAKTLTLYGVTVTTNATTQFVNKLATQSNVPYSLSDVQQGNFVEVRGYETQNHTAMTAVTLERRTPDNRLEIQATASNVVAPPTFKLFGSIIVDTTNVSGLTSNFFPAKNNALVNVRGPTTAWSPPTFMADSAQ